tara:strand:- start:3776 stop:4510 length:735 start_codon:yes stop_codon:yes gene_type:complete
MDLSLIITTYNYEKYIENCVESCLNQQNHSLKYEIIIIDDGSTDNTSKLLAKMSDDRISVYEIDNCGIEKASNYGIARSRGRYIVRVDADDCLMPQYINSVQRYLGKGHAFIYPNYNVIDGTGKLVQEFRLPSFNKSEIFKRGDFLATGTVYDCKFFDKHSFYNCDKINSGLENYELILRLINKNFSGFHISLTLFNYRRHSHNMSYLKQKKIIDNGNALFLAEGWGKFSSNKFHPYGLKVPGK